MAGSEVGLLKLATSAYRAMWKAMGFAVMIIVIAVLLPSVFQALQNFLLVLLGKATQFVQELPAPNPAASSRQLDR